MEQESSIASTDSFIFTQSQDLAIKIPVNWELLQGKADEQLRHIPDDSVSLFVTSPPYFRKFDYGHEDQAGLENTLAEYLEYQTTVAREMLGTAKPNANLFLVIQDTFNMTGGPGGDYNKVCEGPGQHFNRIRGPREKDYPRKAQLLIPERLRIAFTDAGWVPVLKIIWDKSDPRRAAEDRPSYSYEEILAFSRDEEEGEDLYVEIMLFSADPTHYFNRMSVLAPFSAKSMAQLKREYISQSRFDYAKLGVEDPSNTKRKIIKSMKGKPGAFLRAVWRIASGNQPVICHNGKTTRGIASFPMLLAEICVNLGSKPGDIVCDPYSGLGTTMLAALKWGRNAVGIELNTEYCEATKHRLKEAGFQ